MMIPKVKDGGLKWILLPAVILAAALVLFRERGVRAQGISLQEAQTRSARIADEAGATEAAQKTRMAVLRGQIRRLSDCLESKLPLGTEEGAQEDGDLGAAAQAAASCLASRSLISPDARDIRPALAQLSDFYAGLPRQAHAESLMRMIPLELRWAGTEAQTPDEFSNLLRRELALPGRISAQARLHLPEIFPENIPLAKIKRMSPILVFLMKHRMKHPSSYARTTAASVIAGRLNVGVGAELEGRVQWAHLFIPDGDYVFNIGDLHLEITPEWRLLHPGFPKPKNGDWVKVKGWTYYDIFHKAEPEYNSEDPAIGTARKTLWEIHPLQDLTIVP